MGELQRFLDHSPLARAVELSARVVLHRPTLTPADAAAVQQQDSYGPIPDHERVCELEVDGRVVAKGRIVRGRGGAEFVCDEVTL